MRPYLFSIALLASSVNFTNGYAEDRCDSILRGGVWEYTQTQNSTRLTDSFLNWFCSRQFSSFGEMKSSGGKIGIPVEEIPLEVGGFSAESQFGQYYNSACSRQANKFTYSKDFKFAATAASQAITSAWQTCLSIPGVYVHTKYGASPGTFTVTILNRPETTSDTVNVESMLFDGDDITCKPTIYMSAEHPFKLPALREKTFLCANPNNRDITMVVNADRSIKPSGGTIIINAVKISDPSKYYEVTNEHFSGSKSIISDKVVIKNGAVINIDAKDDNTTFTVSAKSLEIEGPFTVNGAGAQGKPGSAGSGCHPQGGCSWRSGPEEDKGRCNGAWNAAGTHPHDVGVPGEAGGKGGHGVIVRFFYEEVKGPTAALQCNVPGGPGGPGGTGGPGRLLINCANNAEKRGPTGPQGPSGPDGEAGSCTFTKASVDQ